MAAGSSATECLFPEVMSTFANLPTDMGRESAFGTALLPGLPRWLLLNRRRRCSFGPQLQNPRFIRLFDRALGMNTAQRVGRHSTHRADILGRWRQNNRRLFAAHGVSFGWDFTDNSARISPRRRSTTAVPKKSAARLPAPRPVLFHVSWRRPSDDRTMNYLDRHGSRNNRQRRLAILSAGPR
jgi:hypothetical protein